MARSGAKEEDFRLGCEAGLRQNPEGGRACSPPAFWALYLVALSASRFESELRPGSNVICLVGRGSDSKLADIAEESVPLANWPGDDRLQRFWTLVGCSVYVGSGPLLTWSTFALRA